MITSNQPSSEPDEDWGSRDSAAGYELYLALCREELRQGKPLPPMFARRSSDKPEQAS